MNHRTHLLIATVLFAAAANALSAASCIDSLSDYRTKKVDELLNSTDSPFSEAFRLKFNGFSYYDGDEAYCVDATFEPIDDSKVIDYPTFNQKTIPFRRVGVFHFKVNGRPEALAAFQRMDLPEDQRQWLLIMFEDQTNGKGTYGGGRYLQVGLPIRKHTILDFNRADNPYCAYEAQFACPVAPSENLLKTAIPVGEKDYVGPH